MDGENTVVFKVGGVIQKGICSIDDAITFLQDDAMPGDDITIQIVNEDDE